jgi:hypothetical protein
MSLPNHLDLDVDAVEFIRRGTDIVKRLVTPLTSYDVPMLPHHGIAIGVALTEASTVVKGRP